MVSLTNAEHIPFSCSNKGKILYAFYIELENKY